MQVLNSAITTELTRKRIENKFYAPIQKAKFQLQALELIQIPP